MELQEHAAATGHELQPSERVDHRQIGINEPGHVDARRLIHHRQDPRDRQNWSEGLTRA